MTASSHAARGLTLVCLALAACDSGELIFSATLTSSTRFELEVNGKAVEQNFIWWQRYDSYEQGENAERLLLFRRVGLGVQPIDEIGPGYCRLLCLEPACQSGLIAVEAVRIVIDSTVDVRGTCEDYAGNTFLFPTVPRTP